MTAKLVAQRREPAPDFASAQAQRLAQQVASKANNLETRLTTLERLVPISVMLAANFTTTLNTAQPTKLAFPVAAGDMWDVEYWTYVSVSGDALGMKYAIGAPTGTTINGVANTSLTSATDITYLQFTAINTLSTAVHTVNGGFRFDDLNVRVKVGATAGFITLQACSTTATRTTTIAAKSYLRAHRVLEV